VGRIAVNAGDNAERSSVGLTHDILASGGGLGLNGCRTVRGIGLRNKFHWRALLFGHHHGGAGKKRNSIRLIF